MRVIFASLFLGTVLGGTPVRSEVGAPLLAQCFSGDLPERLLRTHSKGNREIWFAGAANDERPQSICLAMAGCVWRVDSPPSGPPTVLGRWRCDLEGYRQHLDETVSLCVPDPTADAFTARLSTLLTAGFGVGGALCDSVGADNLQGRLMSTGGAGSALILSAQMNEGCFSLLAPSGEAGAGLVFTSSCTAAMTEALQALATTSQPLLIAVGEIGLIAQGLREEGRAFVPSDTNVVRGGLNERYVSDWLAEIARAAESIRMTEDERDPLPQLTASTPVQSLLHWFAAAFGRVEPPPSQTPERSADLRDWLAAQALSQEPPRPELHFRSELARD